MVNLEFVFLSVGWPHLAINVLWLIDGTIRIEVIVIKTSKAGIASVKSIFCMGILGLY